MGFWTRSRAAVRAATLMVVAVSATACLGPTYGTDKTATEQLINDIGDMASIKPQKGQEIAYSPRPSIVKPPNTASLPAPQQNVAEANPAWVESPEATRKRLVAEADANQESVNYRSPLARVSDTSSGDTLGLGDSPKEADAGPSVLSLLKGDRGRPRPQRVRNPEGPKLPTMTPRNADAGPTPTQVLRETEQASSRFEQNLKIQKGAYSDRRRYLSDPPLTYRQPAETAVVGDVGESERVKEKRRLASATKEKKGSWFKIPLPWQ